MAKKKKVIKKPKHRILTPEEHYHHMITRWGTQAKWGDAVVYLTYYEMVEYFGEQCEEFNPSCANCTNWVQWNKTGTANISFERDKFMKHVLEGDL